VELIRVDGGDGNLKFVASSLSLASVAAGLTSPVVAACSAAGKGIAPVPVDGTFSFSLMTSSDGLLC